MMKQALAYTMFFGMVFSLPAAADDASLTFNHGIGVDPVTCPATPAICAGSSGTVVLNVVRGQQPGGQIWAINKLKAQVSANGSIQVSGKGLVLGGGDGAGGVPAGLAVYATLSCSSSPTPSFLLSSTLNSVTVSPTGDFQINDMLTPIPTFPCANPLLLIQSKTNMHWFALGIVGSDDD
jgi:hypothetical protein